MAREWQDDIVFLRKVEPGRSDRSYGIHVARLAGLPPKTVDRARQILTNLESDELSRAGRPSLSGSSDDNPAHTFQPGLFGTSTTLESSIKGRLRDLDVENLTPLDALQLLAKIKSDLDKQDS